MSFLPGWFPATAAMAAAGEYTPASMVFNGSDETLRRTLSTSGVSTTIFTYSLWFKLSEHGEIADDLFTVIDEPGGEIYLNAATQFFGEDTGSYGTHGFSIDGSTGALGADVSGNGQHFTGVDMDNSNLDTADLPPWTN